MGTLRGREAERQGQRNRPRDSRVWGQEASQDIKKQAEAPGADRGAKRWGGCAS